MIKLQTSVLMFGVLYLPGFQGFYTVFMVSLAVFFIDVTILGLFICDYGHFGSILDRS